MKKKSTRKIRKKSSKNIFSLFIRLFLILVVISSVWYVKTALPGPCANSISCISNLTGEYENTTTGEFMGKKVEVPQERQDINAFSRVLGSSTGEKQIYVDLTSQKLFAFEGRQLVYEFLISSGKWGGTPTGTFSIWSKLRYTPMSGGSKELGTYYHLPNVPYTMFFYNKDVPKGQGFSIHGAYWHNNFGHPMSHGCVNMQIDEAGKLFYWASPLTTEKDKIVYASNADQGTKVIIYGTTPEE